MATGRAVQQAEKNSEKRCVIIGGADITAYDRIRQAIREEDFPIFCDSGLKHRQALGVKPQLIVGDFDSHENPRESVETIVLPTKKDDTDTVFAMKTAWERGFRNYLLVGVAGERLDHTLGNLSMLLWIQARGGTAVLLDDYSEMEIVSAKPCLIEDCYSFFSLLNISGTARGITIRDAKYPLEDAEITCEYQYGISNEVLPGKCAMVSVREGRLLLIKVVEKREKNRAFLV